MELSLLIPFGLQSLVSLLDEFYCHHQRTIPRWERLGHPLDTLSLLACVVFAWLCAPTSNHILLFFLLCAFSSILITKDEWVHRQYCSGFELWLHAVLFVLHPLVCLSIGAIWIWYPHLSFVFPVQAALMLLYATYQFIYWNLVKPHEETPVQD